MADDSELDYIKTFLGLVHTTMTFAHFSETRDITSIADTERGLIYPPEIMNINNLFTIKRYSVLLSADTEANLTAAINNIAIGANKLNRRQTITSYTRETSLTHVVLINGNKAFENNKKRWDQTISLDITWIVS